MIVRVFLCLVVVFALVGCAGQSGPPPQATAIPYSPTLVTLNRVDVANRWAADLSRLQFISTYMDAFCATDGRWSQARMTWASNLQGEWKDVLWHFEPIPNMPAQSSGVDWGRIVESLVGTAMKVAPLLLATQPKPVLPPGLPPC